MSTYDRIIIQLSLNTHCSHPVSLEEAPITDWFNKHFLTHWSPLILHLEFCCPGSMNIKIVLPTFYLPSQILRAFWCTPIYLVGKDKNILHIRAYMHASRQNTHTHTHTQTHMKEK